MELEVVWDEYDYGIGILKWQNQQSVLILCQNYHRELAAQALHTISLSLVMRPTPIVFCLSSHMRAGQLSCVHLRINMSMLLRSYTIVPGNWVQQLL